jgi:hypothetical protein
MPWLQPAPPVTLPAVTPAICNRPDLLHGTPRVAVPTANSISLGAFRLYEISITTTHPLRSSHPANPALTLRSHCSANPALSLRIDFPPRLRYNARTRSVTLHPSQGATSL